MSSTTIDTETQATIDLLFAAPNDWGKIIAGMSREQRARTEDLLGSLAQKAAYLMEYLLVIGMHGGHDQATKKAQAVARRTRKALGYSYPNRGYLNEFEIPPSY